MVRAHMLYLDGAPIAFCGGEGFRERFRYGIPAYDPEYADYRVGNYVLMKLIEDVCDDPELTLLDFGFEDAEYKRRFGVELVRGRRPDLRAALGRRSSTPSARRSSV